MDIKSATLGSGMARCFELEDGVGDGRMLEETCEGEATGTNCRTGYRRL